ncbi:MAG: Gfo/Idh/MocA family oxidoreductase [Verrucomicrobia bacterium]|nr:Gfo/Idh/MocA family oxidoreductase [Verrucomicrobiota bacterium]
MNTIDRRQFLITSLWSAAAVTTSTRVSRAEPVPKAPPNERLQVGCIGVGGRANYLVHAFAGLKEADVATICDIDSRRLASAENSVEKIQGRKPKSETDFRKLIEDSKIDALVVGTPDHWHAIPTLLGCQAGKDVYVEKPDGHNMEEGFRMVAAARKHKRIIQLGTQSRTSAHFQSALAYIRSGKLGRCLVAKSWESAKQGSIGRPPDSDPPAGVDYDTWLGPAPKRPFNARRFHGNWRWFFDYGTGDLGNDGVHRLDIARWALSTATEARGEPPLGLPSAICASGGKWYFDDMQEWPDTLQVTYEYAGNPGKILTYEMRIWSPYDYYGQEEGAVLYGDQGYIVIGNSRWQAFDPKHKVVAQGSGDNDGLTHIQNFVDCVKTRKRPNADLETVGHISSVLCHAGNISWRVGRKIFLDPATERFTNDEEANRLRTRPEYRKPWVLPEV